MSLEFSHDLKEEKAWASQMLKQAHKEGKSVSLNQMTKNFVEMNDNSSACKLSLWDALRQMGAEGSIWFVIYGRHVLIGYSSHLCPWA